MQAQMLIPKQKTSRSTTSVDSQQQQPMQRRRRSTRRRHATQSAMSAARMKRSKSVPRFRLKQQQQSPAQPPRNASALNGANNSHHSSKSQQLLLINHATKNKYAITKTPQSSNTNANTNANANANVHGNCSSVSFELTEDEEMAFGKIDSKLLDLSENISKIASSLAKLETQYQTKYDQIEQTFDQMIYQLKKRKILILDEFKNLTDYKRKALSKQHRLFTKHRLQLNEFKDKYHQNQNIFALDTNSVRTAHAHAHAHARTHAQAKQSEQRRTHSKLQSQSQSASSSSSSSSSSSTLPPRQPQQQQCSPSQRQVQAQGQGQSHTRDSLRKDIELLLTQRKNYILSKTHSLLYDKFEYNSDHIIKPFIRIFLDTTPISALITTFGSLDGCNIPLPPIIEEVHHITHDAFEIAIQDSSRLNQKYLIPTAFQYRIELLKRKDTPHTPSTSTNTNTKSTQSQKDATLFLVHSNWQIICTALKTRKCKVKHLQANQRYDIRIACENCNGWSQYSSVHTMQTRSYPIDMHVNVHSMGHNHNHNRNGHGHGKDSVTAAAAAAVQRAIVQHKQTLPRSRSQIKRGHRRAADHTDAVGGVGNDSTSSYSAMMNLSSLSSQFVTNMIQGTIHMTGHNPSPNPSSNPNLHASKHQKVSSAQQTNSNGNGSGSGSGNGNANDNITNVKKAPVSRQQRLLQQQQQMQLQAQAMTKTKKKMVGDPRRSRMRLLNNCCHQLLYIVPARQYQNKLLSYAGSYFKKWVGFHITVGSKIPIIGIDSDGKQQTMGHNFHPFKNAKQSIQMDAKLLCQELSAMGLKHSTYATKLVKLTQLTKTNLSLLAANASVNAGHSAKTPNNRGSKYGRSNGGVHVDDDDHKGDAHSSQSSSSAVAVTDQSLWRMPSKDSGQFKIQKWNIINSTNALIVAVFESDVRLFHIASRILETHGWLNIKHKNFHVCFGLQSDLQTQDIIDLVAILTSKSDPIVWEWMPVVEKPDGTMIWMDKHRYPVYRL